MQLIYSRPLFFTTTALDIDLQKSWKKVIFKDIV